MCHKNVIRYILALYHNISEIFLYSSQKLTTLLIAIKQRLNDFFISVCSRSLVNFSYYVKMDRTSWTECLYILTLSNIFLFFVIVRFVCISPIICPYEKKNQKFGSTPPQSTLKYRPKNRPCSRVQSKLGLHLDLNLCLCLAFVSFIA